MHKYLADLEEAKKLVKSMKILYNLFIYFDLYSYHDSESLVSVTIFLYDGEKQQSLFC